jgi:hypothetical protein
VGRGNKLGVQAEDKQQLSPVSVLDSPFDDDDADERSDAGTCSPSSFHRRRSCPPPQDLLHAGKPPALHITYMRLSLSLSLSLCSVLLFIPSN